MTSRTNLSTSARVLCATLCLTVTMAGACNGLPPEPPPPPSESAAATKSAEATEVRSSALLPGINAASIAFSGMPAAGDLGWAASLDDILEVVGTASRIAGYISTFVAAVNAAIVILQFLGFLDDTTDIERQTQLLEAITGNLSWQGTASYIDTHYNKLLGPLNDIAGDNPGAVYQGSTGDMESRAGTSGLALGSAWQRASIGSSNDAASDGGRLHYPVYQSNAVGNYIVNWKQAVPVTNGAGTLVYDWRMGVPFFLKALAARLVIMGHAQPDFLTNHAYDSELSSRRQDLLNHYNTMSNGVQCASKDYEYYRNPTLTVYGCMIVCADIYTGISSLSALTPTHPAYPGAAWPNVSNSGSGPTVSTAKCANVAGTPDYIDAWNKTADQVRRRLPLYPMRQMIDRLYNIVNPGPDLTAETGRIRPRMQGGNLCLAVEGASANPGTPLQLRPCDGSAGQTWRYDRQTGQIVNPALGTCVDQRWSLITGTNIDTWPCEQSQGSPPTITNLAQMWTYDRETGNLQSALGQLMLGKLHPSDNTTSLGYTGLLSRIITGANSGMGFHPQSPGSGWRADTPLELSTFRNLNGRLETFYTGNDRVLYRLRQLSANGSSWSGGLLNASFNAAKQVTVGENQDRRLEVFYIGTNDVLYHTWQNSAGSATWSGEFLLAGSGDRAKQIAVQRNTDGRLEMIFIGVDGVLRRIAQVSANNSWSSVSLLASSTTKAKQIALARNTDGRLEVIFTDPDDVLYRAAQTSAGGAWGSPVHLNASFNAAKKVVIGRNADGRLEAIYIGTNDVLHHTWQNTAGGSSWSGEYHLVTATNKAKQVAVAANADGRIEVFYVGTNDVLYHAWQTSAGGSWSGEFPLDTPDRRAHRLTVGQNLDGRLAVTFAGMNGVLSVMQQVTSGGAWGAPATLQ